LIINAIVDDRLDGTLSALADPTRRRVVELLRSERLRASTIAARVGMTPAATSRHLRVLRGAGLVVVESEDDDARARVYRLAPDRLVALRAWLDQVEAHWTEQLASFKEHVETRQRSDRR
jgi:DNA-binding transcriptional ArsR family regulator